MMRASLFTRNPLCVECERQGRVAPATQRDHIIPLAEGGSDDDDNVQGLCRDCHDAKSKQESIRGRCGPVRVALLPDWLPSPTVPVVVVCGPPGSGKSTYVAGLAGASDLVLDVDDMAAKISGKPLYHASFDERMLAIRERNTRLASLGKPVPFTKVWLIVSAGTPHKRAFWTAKYGELVQMPTSTSECINRINADQRRPTEARQRAIEVVRAWQ
jgi:5-methylcytosine-specific restriction protein A